MKESLDDSGINIFIYRPSQAKDVVWIDISGSGLISQDFTYNDGTNITLVLTPTGLLLVDIQNDRSYSKFRLQIQLVLCPRTKRINGYFMIFENRSDLDNFELIKDLYSNHIIPILLSTGLSDLSFKTSVLYLSSIAYLN